MSHATARFGGVGLPDISTPPSYWLLAALGVLVTVDVAQTSAFWVYEGNPVVIMLGPVGHIAAKIVIFACYGLLFHVFRERVPRTTNLSVGSLLALYGAVVVSNAVVIAA